MYRIRAGECAVRRTIPSSESRTELLQVQTKLKTPNSRTEQSNQTTAISMPPPSPSAPSTPSPLFLPLHATSLPSPPFPRPSSITSLLPCPYPPFTSLAVFLSDSTALLFPSLPSLPPPIHLPSPSLPSLSSFCSILHPSPSLLFLSFSSPHSPTAHHLDSTNSTNSGRFTPVPIRCKPGLFSSCGVGIGSRIESSQNVLAIHSVAASQIWLLFVCPREENGAMVVELKKCAVVQLVNPVYDMCLGLGCLMLGERDGVRVFQLRAMIKGREGKKGKGLVNGVADRSADKNNGKLRTVKVKQNSGEFLSFFVSFNDGGSTKSENGKEVPHQLARAISIHPFSKKTIMVLDSSGDLHFFNLPSNSVMGPNSRSIMVPRDSYTARLDVSIKVRLLAILPNFSTKAQIIWVSDGHHLLKMVSASAMEIGTTDSDTTERNLKSVEILATETIFTGGKIRDIVPISSTAVLALTQEKIYAYGTV